MVDAIDRRLNHELKVKCSTTYFWHGGEALIAVPDISLIVSSQHDTISTRRVREQNTNARWFSTG